jgi:hypothetical protein
MWQIQRSALAMKPVLPGFAFLTAICVARAVASFPATLTVDSPIKGYGRIHLDCVAKVQWTQDSPLVIRCWQVHDEPILVEASIDVFDANGGEVAKSETTGPVPAFEKSLSIGKGETRTFDVTTNCNFLVAHSGNYYATGILRGTTMNGNAVIIDLGRVPFEVDTPTGIMPNQSPEPVLSSGTSRAGHDPRHP